MSVDALESTVLSEAASSSKTAAKPVSAVHAPLLSPGGDGATVKYRTTKSTIFAGSVFKVPVTATGTHRGFPVPVSIVRV